eukprot:COSAG02_NODE_46636_length_347_cov_0.830645_1_plen_102_part_10
MNLEMGAGGRKSSIGNVYENPVSGSAFEQEGDVSPRPLPAGTLVEASNLSYASSIGGDEPVLPESLDAQEGSQQCEIWKESLVEHVADTKENARDRHRRKAQ